MLFDPFWGFGEVARRCRSQNVLIQKVARQVGEEEEEEMMEDDEEAEAAR